MVRTCLLLLAFLAMVGCKKETSPMFANCLLQEWKIPRSTWTVNYVDSQMSYILNDYISGQRHYTMSYRFYYNPNGNIDSIRRNDFIKKRWDYYYTGTRLDSILSDSMNLGPTFVADFIVDVFEYNNNVVAKRSQYYLGNLIAYALYELDSRGNITKESLYKVDTNQVATLAEVTQREYDDKTNPFYAFPAWFPLGSYGPNNPIAHAEYNYQYNPAIDHFESYEYEYNTAGVPTKKIVTNTESGATYTQDYTYTCTEL